MDISVRMFTCLAEWRWAVIVSEAGSGDTVPLFSGGGAFELADAPCVEDEIDYALDQMTNEMAYQLGKHIRDRAGRR
jgi:hypothetical protein